MSNQSICRRNLRAAARLNKQIQINIVLAVTYKMSYVEGLAALSAYAVNNVAALVVNSVKMS
jgi:hypothetical protein